ncbi:MAG TPA: K(+)-transporting ATPase subunit F, partial [Mycobacteriales bacterium]|nr:K(+)-transporting ATPase subunit F [Mycobacteriales bacterium]
DDTLLGVRPSPVPGRGAVSRQSSRDKRRKRCLPGSTVRKEGRAISVENWVGLALAVLLIGYLLVALLFPERF